MTLESALLALVVFVVVAIVETIALGAWWPFYFRVGIPLFRREFRAPGPVTVEIARLEQRFVPPSNLSLLPMEFDYPAGSNWWQRMLFRMEFFAMPLRFRALGRGEYAFREQLFTVRLWYFGYLPIVRGHMTVNGNRIAIVGRLNLVTLAFVAFFVAVLGWAPTGHAGSRANEWLWLAVMLGVVALSYAIQTRRFRKVGEFLSSRSSSSSKSGASRPG